jgi:hypothetical protein
MYEKLQGTHFYTVFYTENFVLSYELQSRRVKSDMKDRLAFDSGDYNRNS